MLYHILRAIIRLGIRLYYRKIEIINREELDFDGPAILIANHPNTLMDGWLMGYASKKKVYFMAKATFFSSPLKRKILGSLGMIPINRRSDGAVKGVNNKDSFEACYQLIERGERLVIFPEGTSFLEKQLREIKSGTARIVLELYKRQKGGEHVRIVPIGLNYDDADSYRGSVKVHVGKSIFIDESLVKMSDESTATAVSHLTEDFRVALSRVFVTMENKEHEHLVEDLTSIFEERIGFSDKTIEGENPSFSLLKSIRDQLDSFALTEPWKIEEIRLQTKSLNERLHYAGISVRFLSRKYRASMFTRQFIQSLLFFVFSLPVMLLGVFSNFPIYSLIGILLKKITKEVEYHAPLSILLGLILYPLYYSLLILTQEIIVPGLIDWTWWKLILVFSVFPFVGWFAYYWFKYWQYLMKKRRFSTWVKERKSEFEKIQSDYFTLKSLIFNE